LDPAYVLVHGQPVFDPLIDHLPGVVGTGVADVVPRRIDERIHRVGFPPRGLAALRALALDEVGALVEWIAGAVGNTVLGQDYRQLIVGHRHVAAARAVDDR